MRIALLGTGVLAEAVADRVPVRWLNSVDELASADRLIACSDGPVLEVARLRSVGERAGVGWLPVRAELGRVLLGPVQTPGMPGCLRCLDLRRSRARINPDAYDAVWRRVGPGPSSWLHHLAADAVAALATGEAWAPGVLLAVELAGLSVRRHRVLPDPMCPVCGELPEDSEKLATLMLSPRPKPDPDTHRTRAVAAELDALMATYVDDETGVVQSVNPGTVGRLVVAGAPVRLRPTNAFEPGFGRSRSYRSSKLTALLEALERYGGVEPGGKRTVVRASFADLAGRAIDPRTFGVHPDESYRQPGFPCRRFTEDEVCKWVWGYSFSRGEPVLVPEKYAYYSTARIEPDDRPFVWEMGNGCALGSCPEEAILHGLLEVAERDAFLMTWYARLPVPRIDLASAPDRSIPLQAAAISAETGYQVRVFDTTLEHAVPTVWAMAVRPDDTGADGPKAVCAGGAGLTLQGAARGALSELGPIVIAVGDRFPRERDRAGHMVDDPALVTGMADHCLLYGRPEAYERLQFLERSPQGRELPEHGSFRAADLCDDLTALVARITAAGMDVVVVDQTTPEHRAAGFCCVKVIVPGAVPITFGYRNRRVDGLPRLRSVPQLLGYTTTALSDSDLNPHPHPFP
ncbi:MAG: TOMM precursor leader peptide-binding protein [Pseudonocardiaceae bacterium]